LSYLDSILLGRKTKCIPSHWMQHVEALHTLESRQNIGRRVPEGVSDMQSSPTAWQVAKSCEPRRTFIYLKSGIQFRMSLCIQEN
jgi:hypothetical protein